MLIATIVGLVSFAGYHFAYEQFERQAVDTSRERLTLYRATLRSTLDRVSHLPRVARLHTDTVKLLRNEKSARELNLYLKSISLAAGSAAIYVLDRNADTVAASNFDTEESFVGNNYRFRPYFIDAMQTGVGRFFAVGVTTGRPGYFISEAIMEDGEPIGVAVVKVEFLELLDDWKNAGENVLISDKDGVVVLASNHDRLYKTLHPISPKRLSEMEESRKFSGFMLEPLAYRSKKPGFSGAIMLEDSQYIVTTVDTSGIGWKLHFLTPLNAVQNSAYVVASILFLLSGLAVIGILYFRSKLQQERLQLVAVEAERVRRVNKRLEEEIQERKKTEARLRDTQAELIQSSRLAALGKMSAAIVHEVNQPVSAIRMFTASGALLLKEKRHEEAGKVFQNIKKMTERLGAITSDLLVFSRKPVANARPVDLCHCVANMLDQYDLEIQEHRIAISQDMPKRPAPVTGSEVRFEQLVSNLLKNAMQSVADTTNPEIVIEVHQDASNVQLAIRDNGVGVDPEIMDQLFDPFFTTKDVGKGVGLGLALCYAIADEAGGRIHCENNPTGGASFTVNFPVAKTVVRQDTKELTDA